MSATLAHAIDIPAHFRALADVRAELVAMLVEHGWPEECRHRIVLACCEATANAIEHGSCPEGAVHIAFRVNGSLARLSVADDGREGSSVPSIDVVPPPPTALRGRGLVIMRSMCDRLEVAGRGAGTEVIMEFDRG